MSTALVLEGGGMRGIYTAGVLDVMTENDIFLPTTYAVSAGACNALSYISKQHGRNRRIYCEYSCDKRYLSFGGYISRGSIFGFDFIFGELAHTLIPFDYKEFFDSTMQLYAGATDCVTGKPVYFGKEDMDEAFEAVIASSSLPVVSKVVHFKDHELLAGGVSESIPLQRSIDDGNRRNVVVLTREKEYVKGSKPDFPLFLLKRKYKRYPQLVKAITERGEKYNNERSLCFEQQEQGNAFVIMPSEPLSVGRYSTKKQELESAYELGVKDAKACLAKLQSFLAMGG